MPPLHPQRGMRHAPAGSLLACSGRALCRRPTGSSAPLQVLFTDSWSRCRHVKAHEGIATNAWPYTLRMTINHGDSTGQISDWAVAVAIIYLRPLNTTEILQVGVCAPSGDRVRAAGPCARSARESLLHWGWPSVMLAAALDGVALVGVGWVLSGRVGWGGVGEWMGEWGRGM
jgi:hypothetical protein